MIFNVEKDANRKKIPGSREKVKHSIDNISMPSILEEQQQQQQQQQQKPNKNKKMKVGFLFAPIL
jgi:hypothetical protein